MSQTRRRVLLAVLLACLWLCFATPALAQSTERWVDPSYDSNTPGWGVTHFATIQLAINAAVAGDTIHVAAGTYSERLTISKSLILQGAQFGVSPTPSGARTVPANESIITESGLSTPNPDVLIEIPAGVTNVTIDGFTLNGDRTNPTADTSVLRIWDDYVTISNNIIDGYYSVLFKGNDHLLVKDNRIIANQTGITVQPNVATFVSLSGNSISPGTSPVAGAQGIYLANCTDCTVHDNTVGAFTGSNCLGGSNLTRLTVSDNRLSNCSKGINIWGTTTFVGISGNSISGCSVMGINIKGQDLAITNNTITGNGVGVQIDKHVLNTERVSLDHNTISGNTGLALNVTALVLQTVDAENNYWGTVIFSEIAPKISGPVDWSPWCSADFSDCDYHWPVHNVTQNTYYQTIQAAVNAAISGDTITAAAGTYVEYVVINKNLTLTGAPGAVIQKPTGDVYYKLPDEGTAKSFRPILLAYGGSITGGDGASAATAYVIQGSGTVNVTISGFRIDGRNAWTGADSNNFADGVLLRNVVGTLSGMTIDKMLFSDNKQFTLGVEVRGDNSNVTLSGNSITEFGRVGILVAGNLGTPVAHLTGNNVSAVYYGPYVTNGIELNYRATGSISGNTVSGATGAGTIWSGACVMLTDADNVSIYENDVSDCEVGISVGGRANNGYAARNNVIRDNTVDNCVYSSIEVNTNSQNTTIRNNTITGVAARGGTEEAGIVILEYSNPASGYPNGVLIEGNSISGDAGFWGIDIYRNADNVVIQNNIVTGGAVALALELKESNSVGKNITIGGATGKANSFSGQTVLGISTGPYVYSGVTYQWTPNVNASGNWLGTADIAGVAAAVSANVDYTPWLASGTDTAPGTPGFQGDFSTLWVDDDSPQTGTVGRIQEGINLVSGSTLNVANGLYKESNLLVDESMTVQGESRTGVVIVPAAEDANVDNAFGSSAQNGFIIKAHNVTITNLTLDGQGNLDLTRGKNNYRAGIVSADASYPGGGGGSWNNLHVDAVTIKYPYRRGISVYPTTVSGTVIENSRVEYVAFNHGMYVAGQSEVLGNEVHRAFQGIVLALDASTPAGLCKVNGNVLTSVGNFVGCWGYNPGTGEYEGQPRAIQFNNSDSAGRQVEIKNNTISDNGFEQFAGAVGIYTRLANSSSLVEGNDITLSSGVSCADDGIQAVGMLLGWSYDNGFLARNNIVHSTKYGIGVMVFGNGTAAHPLIMEGNTLTSVSSAAKDTGDGTGIYMANQYLFGPDKNPSYLILRKGNSISGYVVGVAVERIQTSTQLLTLIAHDNKIAGNSLYGMTNNTGTVVDAEKNWWGSACGPSGKGPGSGDAVSADVDYSPWWADEAMTAEASEGPGGELIIPEGASQAEAQAILDCAAGKTVMFESGTYSGGLKLEKDGTKLKLNGCTVGQGSPAFTISANDVTLEGPGKIDGGGTGSGVGIVVKGGVERLWIRDCEITNWSDDGLQFLGAITGLKLVDNYIHGNGGDGVQFDATPGGTVDIYGNAFRANGGVGVTSAGSTNVDVTYNEWGDVAGPDGTNGDGVGPNVTYNPWVFGKLYVSPATQSVAETEQATVYIKMDVHHLYGLQFDIEFDETVLQLAENPAIGAFMTAGFGRTCVVTDKDTANGSGRISFYCNRADPDAEYDALADNILTLVFDTPDITGNEVATPITVVDSSVKMGAKGGIHIFVDSAVDGEVKIQGPTALSGIVDLQGRDNDSGAVVTAGPGTLYGNSYGPVTTNSWGNYALSSMVYDTYQVRIEMARYLDAYATYEVKGGTLVLKKVKLLGGDAVEDDTIDVLDASFIGARFGTVPLEDLDKQADINADGVVDILDLVLMGGNYGKSSPVPW
ncbi:MAG TPA: right-handed parallel beta-helix repeat-containing protein [Anaerolineae bacterium]|nr:right-handed parallel beta-helix repeat-containing protein [Anaerolineae bacterium]